MILSACQAKLIIVNVFEKATPKGIDVKLYLTTVSIVHLVLEVFTIH